MNVGFFILIFFLAAFPVSAQSKVLINEFLIEPSPQSVELINIGGEDVDISGWHIDDSGGSAYFTIPQGTVLSPNTCISFSSEFNLNKTTQDTIRLFTDAAPPTSQQASLVDSFSYQKSPGSGISFMRVADGESPWQTGTASLGRFNLTGASCTQTPTPTPSPSPTPTQVPQPTPVTETPLTFPTYSNIYISEALVAQDAGQSEWIELYNDNDFTVDLVDWYLDDGEDVGSSPQIFSIEIPKKGYEIFELSSPMFNNSGDTVRLLDFQKQEKDSFSYSKATKGKTLGRTSFAENVFCEQEPSKGSVNNPCLPTTTTTAQSSQSKKQDSQKDTSQTNRTASYKTVSSRGTSETKSPQTIPSQPKSKTGEVLAQATQNKKRANKRSNLKKLFPLLSFSYSSLTIASVLFRMKFVV